MVLSPNKLSPVADLANYLLDPRPYDWGRLLAPFTPPLPRQGEILTASFFGDVFVEDSQGAVWWLNGIESKVGKVAISRDQFFERINREHLPMLKTKLLEQLFVGDRVLKAGMLYGLKIPRSEGGKYHPDNIGAASIDDTFAYLGDLFGAKNAPAPRPPEAAPPKQAGKNGLWGKKK
jgi:hypothetical protein